MRLALWTLLIALASLAAGQDVDYAKWSARLDPPDARAGEAARILIHVKTEPTWHIYGLEQPEGPISTSFELQGGPLKADGKPIAPDGVKKFDANFEKDLVTYAGEAIFSLPVRIPEGLSGAQSAKVLVRYQACTEGTCDIPKDVNLEVPFTPTAGPPRPDRLARITEIPEQPAGYVAATPKSDPGSETGVEDTFNADLQKAKDSGLLPFMWLSFVAGLLALLTPCVFPMIPITVSFFSKSVEGERKTNYGGALAYCLGIVATFTALGLIVTLIFGASGIQQLATNPWVNLALVAVFVALALSLFGMFEIAVPSSILTKLNRASKAAGFVGPVLMGLTFSLTSFTCTVPIVGTLLAGAASGESLLYPVMGMLAFSTAFALPFFFLALFPQAITKLPKSGAWLSTVKVFMGFLEIAAAIKFLSNVDLVWQLGWLTKPVFLALWAAIAIIAALHLFGLIRLPHESPAKPGPLRLGFGAATVAAAVFCLAAIEGVNLGEMEAFLPPDPYPGRASTGGPGKGSVAWRHTYDDAMQAAKSEDRPMFINFTGVTCTNCRWMEKNMFTRADVAAEINKYVPVELYTDRSTKEDLDNRALQRELTKVVTLPVYVLVSPEGKPLKIFQGSTRDVEQFLSFLKGGSSAVAQR
jgi:thiol:disulfide interchange protein DsbD